MPPSGPDVWRTYTNVVYANGTLLVPSYPGVTPHLENEALTTFQHLLPEWRIVPVDCNQLISLGGGVHCMTLNLSRVARLPRSIDLRELPEAGGVFPGDEAIPPRRLIAAQNGWRPFIGAGETNPSRAGAAFGSSDFDTADECEVCCPPGDVPSDAFAAPRRQEPDVPRTRRVPASAFRRGAMFGHPRRGLGVSGPRSAFAARGWHE
jgi:hypothetical protein